MSTVQARMSSVREIGVLLFLMVHIVYSEAPEATFKPEGGVTEIGYCIGVDYITVYRLILGEAQLLANSSEHAIPHSPPADMEGRIQFLDQLLGLNISHLRQSDSGLYRWECWKDKVLASKHEQELLVCGKELNYVEITDRQVGGIELKCNTTVTSLEGKTIQWYLEMLSDDHHTMIIDTSVSLEPLQEELRAVIGVKDGGVSLNVSGSTLTGNFYCLVMDGHSCVSFQNIYIGADITTLYTSVGEIVVLHCPGDKSQVKTWHTPLGSVHSLSENFSLVVHMLSERDAGEYKCVFFASLTLAEYDLVLCPSGEASVKPFSEGDNAVLECSQDKEESHSVQWYRRRPLEEEQLILDSNDEHISVPADLKGRVVLSKQDSSLHLSALHKGDSGEFWCVILRGLELTDDEYPESVDNDVVEDDGNSGDDYTSTDIAGPCISKKVTSLREKADKEGTGRNIPLEPKSQPGSESKSTASAVCGVLAVLVVIAIIA